eukprot:15437576-Alexandrium_andersonii.AAC.1
MAKQNRRERWQSVRWRRCLRRTCLCGCSAHGLPIEPTLRAARCPYWKGALTAKWRTRQLGQQRAANRQRPTRRRHARHSVPQPRVLPAGGNGNEGGD